MSVVVLMSAFSASGGMPSGPAALPDFNSFYNLGLGGRSSVDIELLFWWRDVGWN